MHLELLKRKARDRWSELSCLIYIPYDLESIHRLTCAQCSTRFLNSSFQFLFSLPGIHHYVAGTGLRMQAGTNCICCSGGSQRYKDGMQPGYVTCCECSSFCPTRLPVYQASSFWGARRARGVTYCFFQA